MVAILRFINYLVPQCAELVLQFRYRIFYVEVRSCGQNKREVMSRSECFPEMGKFLANDMNQDDK